MTVSPTARCFVVSDALDSPAMLDALEAAARRVTATVQAGADEYSQKVAENGPGATLAVGETVILLTPPCLSLLKHLIKLQGGVIK